MNDNDPTPDDMQDPLSSDEAAALSETTGPDPLETDNGAEEPNGHGIVDAGKEDVGGLKPKSGTAADGGEDPLKNRGAEYSDEDFGQRTFSEEKLREAAGGATYSIQYGDRYENEVYKRARPQNTSRPMAAVAADEAAYPDSAAIDSLQKALINQRIVILCYDAGTIADCSAALTSLLFRVQDHCEIRKVETDSRSSDSLLSHFESAAHLFRYDRNTVTTVHCDDRVKLVHPLLTKTSVTRLVSELEKSNNHLVVSVEGNIEDMRAQQIQRASQVMVWRHRLVADTAQQADKFEENENSVVVSALRAMAAFLPGMPHEEFFTVAKELVAELQPAELDSADKATRKNMPKADRQAFEKWSTKPDRCVAEASISLSAGSEQSGYRLDDAAAAAAIVRGFHRQHGFLLSTCMDCFERLYFNEVMRLPVFRKGYLGMLSRTIGTQVKSIDEAWLQKHFEMSRILNGGVPARMQLFMDILKTLLESPDTAPVAEQFVSELIERLLDMQRRWRSELLSNPGLRDHAFEHGPPQVREVGSNVIFSDSIFRFLTLKDTFLATNLLLVHAFSEWPQFVFDGYRKLVRSRFDAAAANEQLVVRGLAAEWLFPLSVLSLGCLQYHAYYSFDNFYGLTDPLLKYAEQATLDGVGDVPDRSTGPMIFGMWQRLFSVLMNHARGVENGRARSCEFMSDLLSSGLRAEKAEFVAEFLHAHATIIGTTQSTEGMKESFGNLATELLSSFALHLVRQENASENEHTLRCFVESVMNPSRAHARTLTIMLKRAVKNRAIAARRDFRAYRGSDASLKRKRQEKMEAASLLRQCALGSNQ